VVGIRGDEPFERLRSLQLVGIAFVSGIEIRRGQERRKDGCLLVVRIAAGHFCHGVVVGLQPRAMVHLLVVAHERSDCLDIVLLALALETRGTGGVESGDDVLELGCEIGWPSERVVENDHRATPMGHAATRIGPRDRLEGFRRLWPPERVIERHGTVEFRLRRGVAVDLELHFAEALGSGGVRMRIMGRRLARCAGRKHSTEQERGPEPGHKHSADRKHDPVLRYPLGPDAKPGTIAGPLGTPILSPW
jgi:hypothetical protein